MVIAPSLLALEDDCASRAENQMTNDHAELPEQQCVSWEANEGSLGLACLYLSTVTFPEQACDSQSTSTSIRSGSTEKQSHTISAHCVSGSPIRTMLFPDCVSRQQLVLHLSVLVQAQDLKEKRGSTEHQLCSWRKILNNLLGALGQYRHLS